jgi:hypothetical protein
VAAAASRAAAAAAVTLRAAAAAAVILRVEVAAAVTLLAEVAAGPAEVAAGLELAVVGPAVTPAMGAVDIGPAQRWGQRLEPPPTAIITNPTTTAITANNSAATIPIRLATNVASLKEGPRP